MLRMLPLFMILFVVGGMVDGCAPKKKKRPAVTTIAPPDNAPPSTVNPNGSPIPPPQEPSNPTPTPTPNPNKPQNPNNPTPTPTPNPELPSVPLDRVGSPIIPRTPIVTAPHVIFNNGTTAYYNGGIVSADICQDINVRAYYKPCPTTGGLYCFAPSCGYFTCIRRRW